MTFELLEAGKNLKEYNITTSTLKSIIFYKKQKVL